MTILVFLFCFVFSSSVSAHECIHDTLPHLHHWDIIPQASDHHKYHATAREPIRIVLSTLDLFNSSQYCTSAGDNRSDFSGGTLLCKQEDVFTEEKRSFLLGKVLPAAIAYLSSALRVDRMTSPLVVGATSPPCQGRVTAPANHTSPGVSDADYVLYVSAGPISSSTTVAWASTCSLSSTKRPIVGQANFGPAKLSNTTLVSYAVKVAIHEIMHALGFSSSFMTSNFVSGTSPIITLTTRGKTTTAIGSSEVIAKAKEYFGCSSITGLELEDQGGSGTAGSHWDKRVLMNEVMVGFLTGGEVSRSASAMTLAYFKDTGHYDVDYAAVDSDDLWYGKNAGCGFLNEKCNSPSAGSNQFFCWTADAGGCTGDRLAVGRCRVATYSSDLPTSFQYFADSKKAGAVQYTDYCPFMEGWSNEVCVDPNTQASDTDILGAAVFSTTSRCFNTTDADGTMSKGGLRKNTNQFVPGDSGHRCLRARCPDGGSRLEIQIGTSTEWLMCPTDGTAGSIDKLPAEYVGRILCPAAKEVCTKALIAGSNNSATTTTIPPSPPTQPPLPPPANNSTNGTIPPNNNNNGTNGTLPPLPPLSPQPSQPTPQPQSYDDVGGVIQRIVKNLPFQPQRISVYMFAVNDAGPFATQYSLNTTSGNMTVSLRPPGTCSVVSFAAAGPSLALTSLLLLKTRGLVTSLDDINKYLGYQVRNPLFPNVNITIGDVLSGTTSLVDNGNIETDASCPHRYSLQEYVRGYATNVAMTSDGKTLYSPLNWNASSTRNSTQQPRSRINIALAAALVEQISKDSFFAFTSKNFFVPLEMGVTAWMQADLPNQGFGLVERNVTTCAADYPNSALLSSAEDIARLLVGVVRNSVSGKPIATTADVLMLKSFWNGVVDATGVWVSQSSSSNVAAGFSILSDIPTQAIPLSDFLNVATNRSLAAAPYPARNLSCGATQCLQYRCGSGKCVQNLLDCRCESNKFCDGVCVTSNTSCPTCSGATTTRCSDFSCAATLAACPCPPTMSYRCPNTGVCVANSIDCVVGVPTSCTSTQFQCWDKSCAANPLECPCSTQTPYKCPNNQCAKNRDGCSVQCSAVRCYDSTCASQQQQCSCPPSLPWKCSDNSMLCVASAKDCNVACRLGSVKCWDGTCAPSYVQCLCPPDAPIRCSTNTNGTARCVTEKAMCNTTCPSETPIRCLNGICVSALTSCPCPVERPQQCAGSYCGANSSDCSRACEGYRCWDGTCVKDLQQCPCSALAPFQCDDGRCAVTQQGCAMPCPAGTIRCLDSTCAASLSKCPCTPPNDKRCSDGRCAADTNTQCSATKCPFELPFYCNTTKSCVQGPLNCTCASGSVRCSDTGLCATNCNAQCPKGQVMCQDRSCANDAVSCPCPNNQIRCALTGLCASDDSQCAVKCKSNEVMCWNSVCMASASDCDCLPAAPYRCNDRTCVATASQCNVMCSPSTPFKCRDGSCAKAAMDCSCPDTAPVRCANTGLCAKKAAKCAPCSSSQVQCWNSDCVNSYADCPCPQVASVRCPDGTCAASSSQCSMCVSPNITCWDGICGLSDSCSCPPDVPYRCDPFGTCATSKENCKTSCPTNYYLCWNNECVPGQTDVVCKCKPQKPFKCPTGVCASTAADCPCPTGKVKCGTFCASSLSACSNSSSCPPSASIRCDDGSCASAKSLCPCDQTYAIPTVQMILPSTTIYDADTMTANVVAAYAPCGAPIPIEVQFQWSIRDSTTKAVQSLSVPTNTSILRLPTYELAAGTYIVTVLAGRPSKFPETTSTSTVTVLAKTITFDLVGGNRTYGKKSNNGNGNYVLQVVPQVTNAKKNYIVTWTCCYAKTSGDACVPCTTPDVSKFGSLKIQGAVQSLATGTYFFNATIVGGGSWQATYVYVVDGDAPRLNLFRVTKHNDPAKETIVAAQLPQGAVLSNYVFRWTITGANGQSITSPNPNMNVDQPGVLSIAAGSLQPGFSTVTLSLYGAGSSSIIATSNITFGMAAKPTGGKCTVTDVGSGIAMNSTYTVTTYGWNTNGLTYRFRYNASGLDDTYVSYLFSEQDTLSFIPPLTPALLLGGSSASDTITITIEAKDPATQATAESICTVKVNGNSYVSDKTTASQYIMKMMSASALSGDADALLSNISMLSSFVTDANKDSATAVLKYIANLTASTLSSEQRKLTTRLISKYIALGQTKYALRSSLMSYLNKILSGSLSQVEGQDVFRGIVKLQNVPSSVALKEVFCRANPPKEDDSQDTTVSDCIGTTVGLSMFAKWMYRSCMCRGGTCVNGTYNNVSLCTDCINQKVNENTVCNVFSCELDTMRSVYMDDIKLLNATTQCQGFLARHYLNQTAFYNSAINQQCEFDDDCMDVNVYMDSMFSLIKAANPSGKYTAYPKTKLDTTTVAANSQVVSSTLKGIASGLRGSLGETTFSSDGVVLTATSLVTTGADVTVKGGGNTNNNISVLIPGSILSSVVGDNALSADDLTVTLSQISYTSGNNPYVTPNGSVVASGIVDFSVLFQGGEYPIRNTASPIEMSLQMNATAVASGAKGGVTVCKYYNTTNAQWQTDGVITSVNTSIAVTSVKCLTTHLTSFTTFVDPAGSTSSTTPSPVVISPGINSNSTTSSSDDSIPLSSWLIPLIIGCVFGVLLAAIIVLRKQKNNGPGNQVTSPSRPLLDNEMGHVSKPTGPPSHTMQQHPYEWSGPRPQPPVIGGRNPHVDGNGYGNHPIGAYPVNPL